MPTSFTWTHSLSYRRHPISAGNRKHEDIRHNKWYWRIAICTVCTCLISSLSNDIASISLGTYMSSSSDLQRNQCTWKHKREHFPSPPNGSISPLLSRSRERWIPNEPFLCSSSRSRWTASCRTPRETLQRTRWARSIDTAGNFETSAQYGVQHTHSMIVRIGLVSIASRWCSAAAPAVCMHGWQTV